MALPASAALWFLLAALPLGLAAVWTDLSRMKIPNWITDALALAFVPLGLIALPWQDALWQAAHVPVMLALGLVMQAGRLIGAGDIKFLIAASPYVMLADLPQVAMLLAAFMLAGVAALRLARITPLRRLAPGWASWRAGLRFPFGFAMGPALICYLVLAATA